MDGSRFDGLTRILARPSTRRAFGRASAALLAALGMTSLAAPAMDARQRKRRHKVTLCFNGATIEINKQRKKAYLKQGAAEGSCPPPVVECRSFTTWGSGLPGKICHKDPFQQCCPDFTLCCNAGFNGVELYNCFPPDYHCCPEETRTGACASDQECCPRTPWGPVNGGCAGPEDSFHCCPPNSGGSCTNDHACCSSAMTNGGNLGCCPIGRECCAAASDCDESAGETCEDGCCTPPAQD